LTTVAEPPPTATSTPPVRGRRASAKHAEHIASLDGLRGVAIVLVLLFHDGLAWAHGGYLGVDLFFVLSGFLIAGKLFAEQDEGGSISLRNFWSGRFRRLLPALLAALFGVAVFAAVVAQANAQRGIRDDIFAALLYVANWHVILGHVGYFASSAAPSPVRHLWSLSVEEQFYVLFPFVVLGLGWASRTGRRAVAPILAVVLASTLWTAWLAHNGADATRLYEGTDTRIATILLGVLAVLAVRSWARPPAWLPVATVAAVLAGVVIVASAHGSDRWMYPWGQLGFGLASAVMVVAAATLTDTAGGRLLATRPLVFLGTISYGIYLWHWPIYLVLTPVRTGLDGVPLFAIRVAVSIAVAWLSYIALEQPIRTRQLRFPHPILVGAIAIAAVALIAAVATAGAPSGNQLEARTGPRAVVRIDAAGNLPPLTVPPGTEIPPAIPDGRNPRVALVGDSAAASLDYYRPEFPGIDFKAATTIGCGVMAPATPQKGAEPTATCAGWKQKWEHALADQPDVVVMVLGAWEINPHWLGDQEFKPTGVKTTDAATNRYVDGQLDQAVNLIAGRTHARIAAAQLPCSPKEDLGVGEPDAPRSKIQIVDWFNARLDALAKRHPGLVQVISINDHVCPDGKAVEEVDGVKLRSDGTHWTEESAPLAWRWLMPQALAVGHRKIST
jgi:peptidoglycan/LPS O-acetylase OafA/YrhL